MPPTWVLFSSLPVVLTLSESVPSSDSPSTAAGSAPLTLPAAAKVPSAKSIAAATIEPPAFEPAIPISITRSSSVPVAP